MQGLIAKASGDGLWEMPTLGPALEMQAGWGGRPKPLPPPPLWSPLQSFGLLGEGEAHSASLGTSEASARQMGHVRLAWWGKEI